MQRKSALGQSYEKLQARLKKSLDQVTKLTESTPTPSYFSAPDSNILKNLIDECEDSEFWQNFKKAAPIMFCVAVEEDQNLRQMRDMSFIEELLKTKSILTLLNTKLESGGADIDVVEYAIATKMLEQKLAVLTALNVSVDGDGEDKASFNIFGTNKSIVIDKQKLREAIKIQDTPVIEKMATAPAQVDLPKIATEGISEQEYLDKAIQAIGQLKKTARKTLEKDTFIKVFKYTGDFAKMKNRELKQLVQAKRCEHFESDAQKYLDALKSTLADEEKAYEASSSAMFEKLCITPECFERTQQELMNDPYVSMELFNLGISMEQPSTKTPEALTNEKTIELVKASNDYAFDRFKEKYLDQMNQDPMMMPVLISAIAHDWVMVKHGFTEDEFKAALFSHKIYENPQVSEHMQHKQMELMMMAAQQNPMMMQQMGQMGPGIQNGMY